MGGAENTCLVQIDQVHVMRCTWGPCTIERALPGCPQEHPAEAQHMAVRGGRSRTLLAVPPGCAGCSGQFVLPKGSHGQAATLVGAVGAGSDRVLGSYSISRQIGISVGWWCGGVCAHVQVRFLQPHTVSKSDTSRDNIGRREDRSGTCVLTWQVHVQVDVHGPAHKQQG